MKPQRVVEEVAQEEVVVAVWMADAPLPIINRIVKLKEDRMQRATKPARIPAEKSPQAVHRTVIARQVHHIAMTVKEPAMPVSPEKGIAPVINFVMTRSPTHVFPILRIAV